MKDFRPAIVRMHENGVSHHEIARLLTIPRSTVMKHIHRYEETGSNEDGPGRGRKKKNFE